MVWCEANGVDFLFGLAGNVRLVAEIATERLVATKSRRTGQPERRFKSFMWMTRRSWSRRRRIVAKAEWTKGEANPRFVVICGETSARQKVYCARGEMENRISTIPTSRRPPAAPSVSSCSKLARSCASASAASRSPWRRPVPPHKTGAAPQSGSQSPPSPAPRQHVRGTLYLAGAFRRMTYIPSFEGSPARTAS